MSLAETWLWRLHRPLGRALAVLNRIPMGDRSVKVGRDELYPPRFDRWLAALGWKLGLLARAERRLIAAEVRPGMVVVDVGANLGLHTLALARCVGAAGRVYAIEPDPDCFRALDRAIATAGFTHVRTIAAAASSSPGEATLYRSRVSSGETGLYPLEHASDPRPVKVIALDDLLAAEPRVDFIKLDVQGAELAAIAGLARTLRRRPAPRILCEVCPAALARAGTSSEQLLARLATDGFLPHRVRDDGGYEAVSAAEAVNIAAARGSIDSYFLAS